MKLPNSYRLPQVVQACITHRGLCPRGAHVAVALSGGSDSVALLLALRELGYELEALHCNFALRGEESDADEAFVRDLCHSLGVACSVRHYDARAYAEAQGVSIEMAARAQRYEWFAEWGREHPTSYIAIAHNAQDRVETFLLNLSMGTGLRGLSGMPYSRDAGQIIRPMMDVMPSDVEEYLRARGQSWRTDSTNADEAYQRNYIRHSVIPTLEGLRPSFVQSVSRTMEHLTGAEAFYLEAIARYREEVMCDGAIDVAKLRRVPDVETLLFEILREYAFSSEQCHDLARGLSTLSSGNAFYSSTHQLSYSWGKLYITSIAEAKSGELIGLEPRDGLSAEIPGGRLELRIYPRTEISSLRVSRSEILLDWDALGEWDGTPRLVVRSAKTADRLEPFGLSGSKLISRILIEHKVPRHQREQALLLTDGVQVLWLIGHQAARHYAVGAGTQQVLHIRFIPHVANPSVSIPSI